MERRFHPDTVWSAAVVKGPTYVGSDLRLSGVMGWVDVSPGFEQQAW